MADEALQNTDSVAERQDRKGRSEGNKDTPVEKVEAILERMEPGERSEIVEAVMFHQGPMPPASMLREYDEVVPGLAREIADGAAEERQFRHEMNRRTGTQEFILQMAGLLAMLIALMMMLGIVAYMVAQGQAAAGAGLGGAIIVGVIVALSNYRKRENTAMPSTKRQEVAEVAEK